MKNLLVVSKGYTPHSASQYQAKRFTTSGLSQQQMFQARNLDRAIFRESGLEMVPVEELTVEVVSLQNQRTASGKHRAQSLWSKGIRQPVGRAFSTVDSLLSMGHFSAETLSTLLQCHPYLRVPSLKPQPRQFAGRLKERLPC